MKSETPETEANNECQAVEYSVTNWSDFDKLKNAWIGLEDDYCLDK